LTGDEARRLHVEDRHVEKTYIVIDGGNRREVKGDPAVLRLWDLLPVTAGRAAGEHPEGTVVVDGKRFNGVDLNKTFSDLGILPESNITITA